MTLSLPVLLGAAIGVALGVFNTRLIVRVLEPRLRAHDASATDAERATFERKLVLMWRIILGVEVATFVAIGVWGARMLVG